MKFFIPKNKNNPLFYNLIRKYNKLKNSKTFQYLLIKEYKRKPIINLFLLIQQLNFLN